MSDTSDQDDELDTSNDRANAVKSVLLDLIGETVKLSIVIAELDKKETREIAARWNAFVSTVNAVQLPDSPRKSRDS